MVTPDTYDPNEPLVTAVQRLTRRFNATQLLNKRTRFITQLGVGIAILALVAATVSVWAVWRVSLIVEQSKSNDIVQCKNANEAREANRKIWTLVVQASDQNPNRTPKDIQNAQAFQDYINKLYEPRDCYNLDRHYPIPDPPKFEF